MSVLYPRSIATHFTGLTESTINGGTLTDEIHADATITIAVDYINSSGDVVDIWMKAALSSEEETALDAVCAAHTGERTDPPKGVAIANTSTRDGNIVVTPSSIPHGTTTILMGASDDLSPISPATGLGAGDPIYLSLASAGSDSVDIRYFEPVNVAGGKVFWTGVWDLNDVFHVSVTLPATPVSVNGSNTGNCNLYDLGGYNAIIPAAGDGTHDVDLTQAVPVKQLGGYWDVDKITGEITVSSTPGTAKYHLLDIQAAKVYLMKNIPMGSSGRYDVDDLELSEWIHHNWIMKLEVDKATVGAGKVAGVVKAHRATALE